MAIYEKGAVGSRLLASEIERLDGRVPTVELERMRLCASFLGQRFEALRDGWVLARETVMASNVKVVMRECGPTAKAVLWAHNGHVQFGESPLGQVPTGELLRQKMGDDYKSIGFCFGSGGFKGWWQPDISMRGIVPMTVGTAPAESGASAFSAAGYGTALFDMRSVPKSGPVHDWFAEPRPDWCIGGGFSPADPSYILGLSPVSWPSIADAVIYFDRVLPSIPLRGYAWPSQIQVGKVLPKPENLDSGVERADDPAFGWKTFFYGGFPKGALKVGTSVDDQGVRVTTLSPFSEKEPYYASVIAQCVDARAYRGEKVRFSAELSSAGAFEGATCASMWIRVDGIHGMMSFEVLPLPMKAADGWKKSIVDAVVGRNAESVTFGFTCGGEGNAHGPVRARNMGLSVSPANARR
jgi:hypothetical protein